MIAPRLLIASALVLTGCSAAEFTSNKDAVMAKSVFGEDATGNIRQPSGEEDDAPGTVRQPDGTDDEVDFLLVCSDRRSEDHGNFKRAVAQNQTIQLAVGGKVCSANVNEIKSMVAKKSFTITDARRLCPALVPESGKWASVELIINGRSSPAKRGTIELIYALNKDTQPANEAADELCDKNSSPLVVHVASDINNPLPIALSSQDEGIYFDLLGARNNHSLVRISWFTNHDYRLLTLPDANGNVNGINELFGDNTLGPDGLFSDNGYAALAKYDGTTIDGMFQVSKPDGRIDQNDAIYSRLRLWLDKNFDGQADRRELQSLSRAGIAYIDLEFSDKYSETDRYGNLTTMKSVVGYVDGSLDLIFDLWFAWDTEGK